MLEAAPKVSDHPRLRSGYQRPPHRDVNVPRLAPNEADEIRRILACAPFAVAELLIGNVVVGNISVSNAYRVADVLNKRWRDAHAPVRHGQGQLQVNEQ